MLPTGKRTLLLLLLSLVLALGASEGAFAAGGENPCAANPCTTNPCATKNPCATNPCATNPCATNPCATKNPCGTNPCATNPCAVKNPCESKLGADANIPIRKWPLKSYKQAVKRGAKLWGDTALGTSGTSCASCHPGGALLSPKPWPKHIKMTGDIVTLDQMINFCMINPMKAKPLNWNSQKMTALAAYIMRQTRK